MKILHSDWLDTEIVVFTDINTYNKAAKKNKFDPYVVPEGTRAFYQHLTNSEGNTFFIMCFLDSAIKLSTIVHECSHTTDMILGWRGFDPCTETRAYFLSWLFKETYTFLKSVDAGL